MPRARPDLDQSLVDLAELEAARVEWAWAEYVLEHWLLDPDASDQEIDDARHEVELRRAEFLEMEGADPELPRRLIYSRPSGRQLEVIEDAGHDPRRLLLRRAHGGRDLFPTLRVEQAGRLRAALARGTSRSHFLRVPSLRRVAPRAREGPRQRGPPLHQEIAAHCSDARKLASCSCLSHSSSS